MKILFTICGRAGSKGIKNKNLRNFLDYPLSYYTVSVINLFMKKNKQYDSDIVLNTDSEELISQFQNQLKIPIEVIKRKAELGKDDIPKVAVIQNCHEVIKNRLDKKYDLVVDLDITSPLRTLNDLEKLIQKKKTSDTDVVFSVTDARRNPYFNMVMKSNGGYQRVINSSFNARQEAPEIFDMNASMYAYCPDFLESGKGIFDGVCDVIKMLDTAILDIDHENDFELMEVIANYLFKKNKDFLSVQENIKNLTTHEYQK